MSIMAKIKTVNGRRAIAPPPDTPLGIYTYMFRNSLLIDFKILIPIENYLKYLKYYVCFDPN